MDILYYSVHQILEFDEIILLRQAGHFVFSLGSFFDITPAQPFRPAVALGEKMELLRTKFHEMGCTYRYGAPLNEINISGAFLNLFDLCIVMHDLEFIKQKIFEKCDIPVIWRSIGVSTEYYEPDVNWFADRGGVVVRYSPRESVCQNYAGHDAIIRFGKDPDMYLPWLGQEKNIILFSHDVETRFPLELDFINETVKGLNFIIGGQGNQGLQNSVGVLEYYEQIRLLSQSRVYFYAAGSFIPYTLNFIEACLSGIPVIALNCNAIYGPEMCKFAEIPDLITKYGCGVLVNSVKHARNAVEEIMNDNDFAAKLGKRGRSVAMDLFSYNVITPQWDTILKMTKMKKGPLA